MVLVLLMADIMACTRHARGKSDRVLRWLGDACVKSYCDRFAGLI